MRRTAETQRSWKGAALWSRGFRPFFLAAGLWAVAAVAVWPPFFTGEIAIPTAFSPVDWHVHEMIYGYGSAVVAGFLLTAIPNWTGRLPVAGWPLALLAGLWISGRIAVFFSAKVGWLLAASLDTAFLLIFATVAAREVFAGHNLRNIKVVVLVLALAIANAGFHFEATAGGTAVFSARAGLAVIVFLILLIGGRVVPSFTHNWLARKNIAVRPAPFSKPDGMVMLLSGLALISWIADPDGNLTGILSLVAGLANFWRLSRWRGWVAWSDRLVLVLHVGFFFVTLGFLVAGAHTVKPDIVSPAATVHVWAIGAIGTMTLAMMTRATLGHTGRGLVASSATQFIYLAVVVAMALRVAMEFVPNLSVPMMYGAAIAWVAAFAGFATVYGPMLVRPPRRT
ncbi:NnrS family protein [Labrys sp. KNU-23]|uniref:NnrS family protein n=1 Tax=Labrys sp. KNU-23 TaxID=2789216 RepID=UPI0011ED9E41|nr:NnrS family protein [Labrys sp. KNU-23]QEN84732.1 NnrS family protein [Labrys sp. KNU-23]